MAWALPSLALVLGVSIATLVVLHWTRRNTRSPTHTSISALDEGRRVSLRGTIHAVPETDDARVGDGPAWRLATAHGDVPVVGRLERALAPGTDVVVEGFVARVMRPALREQAGVLALRDRRDERFFEPIRMRRAVPPRALRALLALVVAALSFALATPLAWPFSYRFERGHAQRFWVDLGLTARLSSLTRRDALAVVAHEWTVTQPLYVRVAAQRELDPSVVSTAPIEQRASRILARVSAGRDRVVEARERRRRETREAAALWASKGEATFPRHCAHWSHRERPRPELRGFVCGTSLRAAMMAPTCLEWSHDETAPEPTYGRTRDVKRVRELTRPPDDIADGGSPIFYGAP